MFDLLQERDFGKPLALRTMVYVITHGEADPNNKDKLSDRGKNQIDELVRSRVVVGVRKVYSSPEKVAMATAGILRKEFEAIIEVKDCFSSVNFGKKKNEENLVKLLPQMWKDSGYSTKEGESLLKARRRISECMNYVGTKHAGDSVAIVTDPLSSTLILWLVSGGTLNLDDYLQMGHSSCASYEYSKDGWILVMPPDDSYLSEPCSVRESISNELLEALEQACNEK